MNIKKMTLAVSADSKEKETYVKYCDDLDLNPEWVETDFMNKLTGKKFTLLGLNKRGHLFTVVIKPYNSNDKEVYSIKQFLDNCIKCEN